MLCKKGKSSALAKVSEENCVRGSRRLCGMKNPDSKLHSCRKVEPKKKKAISNKTSMTYKKLDTFNKQVVEISFLNFKLTVFRVGR